MTCIIGLKHKGNIYMGGDSAGVAGYRKEIRADEKVFVNGKFIFGFTSSFRMGQLLRYALVPPEKSPDMDVYKFMVTDFVNAVRNCLKDGGYATKKDEAEVAGTFLVGYEGHLFKIDSDYQVGESREDFAAAGCGEEFALGAMAALETKDPVNKIFKALTIVESYCTGVAGPFTVVESKDSREYEYV